MTKPNNKRAGINAAAWFYGTSFHAPRTVRCPFCGEFLSDDPDAYYHRKDCERRDVQRRLAECKDADEMRRLKARLEQASYTGD